MVTYANPFPQLLLAGIYLTCTMAITTLSMVLTVFVLNLHHITDRPVPPWARKLVLIYLARMLGICIPGTETKLCRNKRKKFQNIPNNVYRRASVRIDPDGKERTTIIELQPRSTVNGGEMSPLAPSRENAQSEREDLGESSQQAVPKETHEVDYAKDWRRVAEVFDRLFFWLFLLAILISTLVLFHPLTDSYLKRV